MRGTLICKFDFYIILPILRSGKPVVPRAAFCHPVIDFLPGSVFLQVMDSFFIGRCGIGAVREAVILRMLVPQGRVLPKDIRF